MTWEGITFINGSPRRRRSTSSSIIDSMRSLIRDRMQSRVFDAYDLDLDDNELLRSVADSRFLILVSPLYVDSLPSEVVEMMQVLERAGLEGASFMVIFNCGFPESTHNDTVIDICRNFSTANGMNWLGGLAIGGGGAIDGRPLSPSGPERNVLKSLAIVCDSIVEGVPIPEEAFVLASRQFFPVWLYMIAANHLWRTRAKAPGVKNPLKHRPYG